MYTIIFLVNNNSNTHRRSQNDILQTFHSSFLTRTTWYSSRINGVNIIFLLHLQPNRPNCEISFHNVTLYRIFRPTLTHPPPPAIPSIFLGASHPTRPTRQQKNGRFHPPVEVPLWVANSSPVHHQRYTQWQQSNAPYKRSNLRHTPRCSMLFFCLEETSIYKHRRGGVCVCVYWCWGGRVVWMDIYIYI